MFEINSKIAIITYKYKELKQYNDKLTISLWVYSHAIGRKLIRKEFTFPIPMSELTRSTTGVSSPIGLLRPLTNSQDKRINSVFERNLAEMILKYVHDYLKEGYHTILIQGPMFPKLRGRIGYRHFSHDFNLASVTFDQEWLNRESSLKDKSTGWSTLLPPFHQDAYYRTFNRKSEGDCEFSVEIMCQMAPHNSHNTWTEKKSKLEFILEKYGTFINKENTSSIPLIMLPAFVLSETRREPLEEALELMNLLHHDLLYPGTSKFKKSVGKISSQSFRELYYLLDGKSIKKENKYLPRINNAILELEGQFNLGHKQAARNYFDFKDTIDKLNAINTEKRIDVWNKFFDTTPSQEILG